MENQTMLDSNLESQNEKNDLPQNENEVVEQTEGQQTVEVEEPEQQPASAKWCVYIGYTLVALGLLDFCLGNFGGTDLVFTFKYTPVIFGAAGAFLIKNSNTFGYRELFAIVGLIFILVIGTVFVKTAMQKADIQPFVGQWEEAIDDEVTRQYTLKEDKTFILKIIADDGSAEIQGNYELVDVEGNKKCMVLTYDINTLTEPELKDFFTSENEEVKKAEKENKSYGIIGVRVEGNTLLYDGGSLKRVQTGSSEILSE